jgi:hypothetical protein
MGIKIFRLEISSSEFPLSARESFLSKKIIFFRELKPYSRQMTLAFQNTVLWSSYYSALRIYRAVGNNRFLRNVRTPLSKHLSSYPSLMGNTVKTSNHAQFCFEIACSLHYKPTYILKRELKETRHFHLFHLVNDT